MFRRRERRLAKQLRWPLTESRIHQTDLESGIIEIIAIDPGGTTGWVRGYFPMGNLVDRKSALWVGVEVEYGQVGGDRDEDGQAIELDRLLAGHVGPVVVESFSLRQFRRDSDLLAPVRIEAKLDYIIRLINNARQLETAKEIQRKGIYKTSQTPALAKQTGTDDRLREIGLYVPGMPHARDAMRHLFTYARRTKGSPPMVWPQSNVQ